MTKHTPGPWKAIYRKYGDEIYYGGEERGGMWEIDGPWQCYLSARDETAKADAYLIAAAPQLLEACQAFVVAWEKSLQLEKTDVALRLAKMAIDAATGEQP